MLQKTCHLNKEQRNEINKLLTENKYIASIIIDAQLCLCVEGMTRENILRKIMHLIDPTKMHSNENQKNKKLSRKYLKILTQQKKIQLEAITFKDLEQVIDQVLQDMEKYQQKEFFNYLAYQYTNNGYIHYKKIDDYLIQLTLRSLLSLKFQPEGGKKLKIPQDSIEILEKAGKCSYDHHYFNQNYKKLGLFGTFFCVGLFFINGFENNFEMNDFQIRNIFFILLGLLCYFYSSKIVDLTFNPSAKELFHDLNFSHVRLEEVRIMDSNYKIKSISYLPNYDPREEEKNLCSPTSWGEGEESYRKNISKKNTSQFFPANANDSPAPIPSSIKCSPVSWSGTTVWFGEKDKDIVLGKSVHEMRAPFFLKEERCFGFFNSKALEIQGLKKQDPEWKNYKARVKKGTVVPRYEKTGIKILKPRILAHPKIMYEGNKHDFGPTIFYYSAKTIGTVYRLLCRLADIRMSSDGTRYKLYDFCWHCPKGPGH